MAFRLLSRFRLRLGSRGGLPPFIMREVSSDAVQSFTDDIVTMLATGNFTMADHTKAQKPITIKAVGGTTTFIGTTTIASITVPQSVTFYPRPSGWEDVW